MDGVAAAADPITLATFDIEDLRLPSVKAAWLDNMAFYRADLERAALDREARARVAWCDLLFVARRKSSAEHLV